MIINLTPHKITVIGRDESQTVFPPSGNVARVATTTEAVGDIDGLPAVRSALGDVTGLPAPVAGTWLLVSGMVLDASGRPDLCAPGALVRGPDGQPTGCRGLRVAS